MPELLAFTADQVSRLTGISTRQLGYWDQTDFFAPFYADENRRRPFSRVYSFRDVVALRTLAELRNKYRVPLQELRKVRAWLVHNYETPWAKLTFYVAGRRVYFDDPSTGVRFSGRGDGQTAMPFGMERVAQQVEQAAEALRHRSSSEVGRVSQHRYIAHNAPVLAGTRIPTAAIANFHEAGYSTEQILSEYPQLTARDVRAAIVHEQGKAKKRAS